MARTLITSSLAAACLAGFALAHAATAQVPTAQGQALAPATCASRGASRVVSPERAREIAEEQRQSGLAPEPVWGGTPS